MGVHEVVHKLIDVAAGVDRLNPDDAAALHASVDEDSAVEPSPGVPAEDAAPEPVSEPVPAPEPAPVDDEPQVQEQVQEGDGAEADA